MTHRRPTLVLLCLLAVCIVAPRHADEVLAAPDAPIDDDLTAEIVSLRRILSDEAGFAGFWLEGDVLHLSFVGPRPTVVEPVGLTVVFHDAGTTFDELISVHSSVSRISEQSHLEWVVGTAVDERVNRIVLFTNDPLRTLPAELNLTSARGIPLVTIDDSISGSETTTIIRGGQSMASGCTAGFAVKADGYRGMLTAGHTGCGNVSPNSQYGVSLCCPQEREFSTGQDRSIYAISEGGHGVSREIRVRTSGLRHDISDYYENGDFFSGMTLNKFGNTSHHRQGTIQEPNYDPSRVPGVGFMILMDYDVPSWSGDSGGPVYANHRAAGMTSGCIYTSPAEGCGSSEPAGLNRAVVGKIQANISSMGAWSLYLKPTDGA